MCTARHTGRTIYTFPNSGQIIKKLRANNQFVGKITKRLGKITKRLGKITKSLERFGYFPYKLVIRPEIPKSGDSAEIRRK